MKTATSKQEANLKSTTARTSPRSSINHRICGLAGLLMATLLLQGCATQPNAARAQRENGSHPASLASNRSAV